MKASRGKQLGPGAGLGFILAFILLATAIAGGGYLYYSRYAANYRTEMGNQLSAIGQLKAEQLTTWRAERLGDASSLLMNGAFAALAEDFLNSSGNALADSELGSWLASYQVYMQYDEVRLLDAAGVTRLSVPSPAPPLSLAVSRQLPKVLQSGRATLVDFYRTDLDQAIRLTVLAPIRGGRDRATVIGIVALRVDPAVYLYPFISRWPTASATAETLLVRRDGSDALFLNELKFRADTALTLRVPLASADRTAVKAAMGETGIVEGLDYRGVGVLADVRAVPGSPWFLVARIDLAEVDAPLRDRLWQTVTLVAVALVGTGAGLAFLLRHREARLYRARAEAAEAQRASELRYRRLFESAKDGILILDAETGTIVDVNPFLVELLGFSPEGLLGKRVWELGFLKDIVANEANFAELQQKEYVRYEDMPLETADGRRIEVEFISNVYLVNRQKVVQCSIRDITERKRAEEDVERVSEELTRSNRDLEQFAYVASHDLQEPLRMVSSYVQLLAQRYEGQLDDKARKYINYAVDGAVRMQRLIEDLLDYSRVGTRGGPLGVVDSRSALASAIQNLAKAIEESATLITEGELPLVRGDAPQLTQVFQNLLSNAIKFHGEAPPRVHVSAEDNGREWVFSVKDTGIGIDPQYKDRVFVIFQRLHTRQEFPGTGIGLAICKRIVERHGGRMWFESEPGKGSTFFFSVLK